MEETTTITGYVEDIVFHNSENGYSVLNLQCESNRIVVVGKILSVRPGENLDVTGRWTVHRIYGKQFLAERFERRMPDENDAMVKYLASGFVKGIGFITARRIVDEFGADTWRVIQETPEKLGKIKGISIDKAIMVSDAIKSQKSLTETILFFTRFGMSPEQGAKAYKYLGDNAVEKIRGNPYLLVTEDYGISFRKADMIAAHESGDDDSYLTGRARIFSGIRYILQKASLSGHTYLPDDVLIESCRKVLGISGDGLEDHMDEMTSQGLLKSSEGCHYLIENYNAEKGTADKLGILSGFCFDFSGGYRLALSETLEKFHVEFDAIQEKACISAIENGVSVISGGPGTGKTTIIKALIEIFERMGKTCSLAAPTGRAAKRMENASGRKARTIHRLLEIDFVDDEGRMMFSRNKDNPLESDVIIVDEMSMVDINLMYDLVSAVSAGSRLVLIGDVDQLPAVGPGNVLGDIIGSGMIPCTILRRIYRQETGNMIPVIAGNINEGIIPGHETTDGSFRFIEENNPKELVGKVMDIISMEKDRDDDIQVIIPGKKGYTGTMNMNRLLQERFNPEAARKRQKSYGNRIFREGDKVMQTKNNYSLEYKIGFEEGKGIFNGDIGYISNIEPNSGFMEIIFEGNRKVEYDMRDADQLETAYAITVHKSQGSEYNTVILILDGTSPMLQSRNLLYTAVSRAVDKLYIIGSDDIFVSMISNENKKKRYSGLAGLLG